MKLSTLIIAGMALAGAASQASATASVFEQYNYTYGSDTASVGVTNNDTFAYTDVVVNGVDLGALAAGASASTNVGDPYEGGATAGVIAITTASHGNGAGTFGLGDFDDANLHGLGTITFAVPEPAAWALMLVVLGGLGMAMRRRRAALTA